MSVKRLVCLSLFTLSNEVCVSIPPPPLLFSPSQIMSDEDLNCPRSHSSDASSSSSEAEPASLALPHSLPEADRHPKKSRGDGGLPRPPMGPHFDLPIVYAPHSSKPSHGAPVQQYKCKYPGCTQVGGGNGDFREQVFSFHLHWSKYPPKTNYVLRVPFPLRAFTRGF